MIIPVTLIDALKGDFPNESISLNPGSGTINVNGVNVVLSGFKDGVIEQFSKHDPLFKAEIYGKVKFLVGESIAYNSPGAFTKAETPVEEEKKEDKKEERRGRGRASTKEATPEETTSENTTSEEEAKFLNDESSEA